MQAIILAAGMGKRLGEKTKDNTKCMLEVNGIRLIDRVLEYLHRLQVSRVVLVVGYQRQNVKDHVGDNYKGTPIVYVDNEVYDKTNNIYSLYLAKDYLVAEDTILLESDLIYEFGVLEALMSDAYPNIALVDKYESWMDGTVVTIDSDNRITRFIDKSGFRYDEIKSYYKTVNIYKFSKEFSERYYVPFLTAYCIALGQNEYYEQVLKVILELKAASIKALPLNGELWYEIDDIQDFNRAECMFGPNADTDIVKEMAEHYEPVDNATCFNEAFRKKLLDTFQTVTIFLNSHGLKWWVAFGTCLGAVRHKNIIPWDDDIDIMMPRNDYNELLKMHDELASVGLASISIDNSNYYLPYAKIYNTDSIIWENRKVPVLFGMYIDIFPIDQTKETTDSYSKKCRLLYRSVQNYRNSIAKYPIRFLISDVIHLHWGSILNFCMWKLKCPSFLSDKYLQKLKNNLLTFNDKEGDSMVTCSGYYGSKEIFPKEWFNGYLLLDFGNFKVKALVEYDKYLKQIYGDYMKYPPIEQQITHHSQFFINCRRSMTKEEIIDEIKKGNTKIC